MRIARIIEQYPSTQTEIDHGLMPNAYYLSTYQVRMGHEVRVYTIRQPGQPRVQEFDGVQVVRISRPRMTRTFMGLKCSRAVREDGFDPEIVHALNPLPLGWLHRWAARVLPSSYVMSLHASLDPFNKVGGLPSTGKLFQVEFRRLALDLARHVDMVIAVSRFVGRELASFGIERSRIKVIPSGVDTKTFSPSSNGKDTSPSVLYVGRFSRGKDLPTLLRAVAIVSKEMDIHLTLVGGRPFDDGYSQVKETISALGISGKVTVLPPLPHRRLPEIYRSSCLAVLPSRREALGKVLLEAMACGVPVVASRVGGITDIVENGKNGLLVRPSCPECLAESISLLLADEKKRRKMSARARRTARMFDWRKIAAEYIAAFNELHPN